MRGSLTVNIVQIWIGSRKGWVTCPCTYLPVIKIESKVVSQRRTKCILYLPQLSQLSNADCHLEPHRQFKLLVGWRSRVLKVWRRPWCRHVTERVIQESGWGRNKLLALELPWLFFFYFSPGLQVHTQLITVSRHAAVASSGPRGVHISISLGPSLIIIVSLWKRNCSRCKVVWQKLEVKSRQSPSKLNYQCGWRTWLILYSDSQSVSRTALIVNKCRIVGLYKPDDWVLKHQNRLWKWYRCSSIVAPKEERLVFRFAAELLSKQTHLQGASNNCCTGPLTCLHFSFQVISLALALSLSRTQHSPSNTFVVFVEVYFKQSEMRENQSFLTSPATISDRCSYSICVVCRKSKALNLLPLGKNNIKQSGEIMSKLLFQA